mmetsp:Transcript_28082/g.90537  ORF Transcript_28082/g.90537 Transcript_28082/m.90537 type:complete len:261 (+) Transcript_28082:285-1067(+)
MDPSSAFLRRPGGRRRGRRKGRRRRGGAGRRRGAKAPRVPGGPRDGLAQWHHYAHRVPRRGLGLHRRAPPTEGRKDLFDRGRVDIVVEIVVEIIEQIVIDGGLFFVEARGDGGSQGAGLLGDGAGRRRSPATRAVDEPRAIRKAVRGLLRRSTGRGDARPGVSPVAQFGRGAPRRSRDGEESRGSPRRRPRRRFADAVQERRRRRLGSGGPLLRGRRGRRLGGLCVAHRRQGRRARDVASDGRIPRGRLGTGNRRRLRPR